MQAYQTEIKYPPRHQYEIEKIFKEDYETAQKTLESIDFRIAERKKLEHKLIGSLEVQRQKIEDQLNSLYCFRYNPNPKVAQIRSGLETEMVRIELRKGEEAVNSFRDVERLEFEKRKIMEDMRGDKIGVLPQEL